jgi:hypothetical protein
MTMPPPPGPWNPGGQPPTPPPGYYPQQPSWGAPPPPKPNNTIKWLLIGVGLLLVIAITVGVTVLVTNGRPGGDGQSTTTSASGPPIASADDNGPVEIITSEPTCQAWAPLSKSLGEVQDNGWGDRDPEVPGSAWTADQRAQAEAVAQSMVTTADQAIKLARQTPNRVVRELYEQFAAFARAYEASLPTYSPRDNYLALANIAASSSIGNICNAVTYGSALSRSASASVTPTPSNGADQPDPDHPERVVTESTSTCSDVIQLREGFIAETAEWIKEDPNVPSSDWTPERKSQADATGAAISSFASNLESTGQGSENATFRELTSLSALYFRAYADALPTYLPGDNPLFLVGSRTINLLGAACEAVR